MWRDRDQQDQILYLMKDPDTQIWSLERTGSPTDLADQVNIGLAANALTKYLNIRYSRLLDKYHVRYRNKARHSGRRVSLTYMLIDNPAYTVVG